jgi:hypothetical protein
VDRPSLPLTRDADPWSKNVAVTEVGEWTAHVAGTAMIDEKWRSP